MITVVGMGPGSREFITPLGQRAISEAEVLVGWPRHLAVFADHPAEQYPLGSNLDQLAVWLRENARRKVVVLASGDPLLFGIGKRLAEELQGYPFEVIPGISSVQYLFSRLALDMNDIYLTSSHGRQPDFDFILQHDKVAMVTDRLIGPWQIAQEILQRGLQRQMIIGENLTYPNEQIFLLRPEEVAQQYAMNVVVILNER